jgi:hypothetical protein
MFGVAKITYLGTTLTNQNYIRDEIENELNLGKCLLSFSSEYVLSSLLRSKNAVIKIYKTIILPAFSYVKFD